MGSWMAASFRPSTGPSSLPVSTPSYSKVHFTGWPGDEGRAGGNADGAVGGALAVKHLARVIGDLGNLQGGMKAEVHHFKIWQAR